MMNSPLSIAFKSILLLFFAIEIQAQRKMDKFAHSLTLDYGFQIGFLNNSIPSPYDKLPLTLSLEYEFKKNDDAIGIGLVFIKRRYESTRSEDTVQFYNNYCDPNRGFQSSSRPGVLLSCYYCDKRDYLDFQIPIHYARYFYINSRLTAFGRLFLTLRFDSVYRNRFLKAPTIDSQNNFLSYDPVVTTFEKREINTPFLNYGLGGGLNYELMRRISLSARIQYQMGKTVYPFRSREGFNLFNNLFFFTGVKFRLN